LSLKFSYLFGNPDPFLLKDGPGIFLLLRKARKGFKTPLNGFSKNDSIPFFSCCDSDELETKTNKNQKIIS
jgi:hypothetical protein